MGQSEQGWGAAQLWGLKTTTQEAVTEKGSSLCGSNEWSLAWEAGEATEQT